MLCYPIFILKKAMKTEHHLKFADYDKYLKNEIPIVSQQ